jgi:glycerol 3-phosphatase-2
VLADPYDAILLDLDGVLYRWPEPIPGAAAALAALRDAGKRIAFLTNNSSRTPSQVAERLGTVGVEARPEEVVTSALATATVLAERGARSAFVVGEEGLLEALAVVGIRAVSASEDVPDVVVVGFDRSVDYGKLRDASVLVGRGVPLVASNADASFPAPSGESWPGAGALLAAIETTTGARGEVFGKPEAPLFARALAAAGGTRPLVVGDRLDTDIAGAVRLGWDSALVLTGAARRRDVERSPWKPTLVLDDLSALLSGPGHGGRGILPEEAATAPGRVHTMVIDDIRKTFEAVIGQLSPAKAQQLAKRYLEPGAAKEQVAKTAGELIQLSQRLRDTVRKEVTQQLRAMGAATQSELDALRKRVRDLERAAGMTASGRSSARRKTAARKTAARTTSARKKTAAARTTSTGARRKPSSAS